VSDAVRWVSGAVRWVSGAVRWVPDAGREMLGPVSTDEQWGEQAEGRGSGRAGQVDGVRRRRETGVESGAGLRRWSRAGRLSCGMGYEIWEVGETGGVICADLHESQVKVRVYEKQETLSRPSAYLYLALTLALSTVSTLSHSAADDAIPYPIHSTLECLATIDLSHV
jgi:hypothetical protein